MSQITAISTSPGGSTVSAAATWTVRAAAGQAPQRIFERRLYLRLPTGGAAQVIVDDQATLLDGQIQAIGYDARAAAAPGGPASLSSLGDALVVALDAPRRVTRVDLAAGTAGSAAHTLELYRLDGQRRADDPTVSAGVSAGTERAELSADAFSDLRFALRLKRNDTGSYVALTPAKLAALQVQTRPTSPRIGLAAATGSEAPLVFWQAPGELAPGAPEGQVHAGPPLASALQRQLDRALAAARDQLAAGAIAQLPAHLDVALVIQSDAPCDLSIAALKVVYRLAQASFPGGEPKRVLRFGGASAQQLDLQLPAGATVHAATLRAVESFKAERPAALSPAAPAPEPEPAQRQGLLLGKGTWAAQPFTPPQALSAMGCAIAVMALAVPAELTLELQEDWRGQPSGRRLAVASATLDRAGLPAWVRLPFAAPVVLPAQGHWLVIRAARGEALCLLDAGDPPARLLEQGERGAPWRERRVFDNMALLHRLLAAPAQSAPGGATLAPPAPFTLAVGAETVAGTPGSGDSRSFDLTAALQRYLANAQPVGAAVHVPIALTALAPGLLTVYPPRVEYSL